MWLFASQSTMPLKAQNDYVFQKFGGPWPFAPPGYAYKMKAAFLFSSLNLNKIIEQSGRKRHILWIML